jgi:outer membrane protein OmpA-like peptidoglycan-associated protein
MNATVKVLVLGSLVTLGGCTATQVDYGPLESQIAEAKAGDFGTCYTHVHSAAMSLDKAEAGLAAIKKIQGVYAGPMYDKAVSAVNSALKDRAAADRACNARTAALEAQMPGIHAMLKDHEGRISNLEMAHELMHGVTFHTGSAKLTSPAQTALGVIANILLRKPAPMEVAGFASTPGSSEYNARLATARAHTVKKYLVRKGVSAKHLSAKGYGETWPVGDNNTKEGRRANQRVELRPAS